MYAEARNIHVFGIKKSAAITVE